MAVASPGSWYASEPQRELVGYIYTDKPIYRPGHHGAHQGGAALAGSRTRCCRSIARTRRSASPTPTKRSCSGSRSTVDALRRRQRVVPVPARRRSATTAFASRSGEYQADRRLRGRRSIAAPSSRSSSRPQSRFVVQGNDGGRVGAGALLLRTAGRQRQGPLRRQHAGLLLAAALGRRRRGWRRGRRLLLRRRPAARGRASARRAGHAAKSRCRSRSTRTATTTARASKPKSPMRAAARSAAIRSSTRPPGRSSSRRRRRLSLPAGAAVAGHAARAGLHGQAAGGVAVTVAARAHHLSGRSLLGPDRHRSLATRRRRRPPTAPRTSTLTVPAQAGSYRVRVTTPYEDREIKAETWIWVPGARRRAGVERRRSVSRAARRQAHLRAGRDGAHRHSRRAGLRPGAGDQGRPARHVASAWRGPMRATRIDVPIDRGDVGDIYVNVVFMRDGRLYRAERRLSVPASRSRAADHAHGRPGRRPSRRSPASSPCSIKDATRRAGAGASEPGRHRRSRSTRSGRTTRRIRCATSIAANTAASAPSSRATTTSRASPASDRLQLAARTPPPVHAGRLQGRQAGPAAGPQGLPGRDLLDRRSRHRRDRARPRSRSSIQTR